ncbi:hypothetical protein [Sphingomonas sp. NFR15]|uniref:hypothetical protein n=2 Tax=Sphingomonas TaxID=13687 RepID=UPI000B878992|nr:hypothetical protein [Sphingomonas sp. NFR15]
MANTINLGTLTNNVGTGTGGFIGSASNPSDHITFTLAPAGKPWDVGGSGNVSPPVTIGSVTIGLTTLSAKFYSVVGNVFLGELIAGETKTFTNLVAGSYYVDVTGTSVNGLGGSYSLNLLPAAAPGPAGFLFVGGAAALMASRRRRQKAKLALA